MTGLCWTWSGEKYRSTTEASPSMNAPLSTFNTTSLLVSMLTSLFCSERIIELSNERGLVGSGVVPKRLSPLHQHLVGIGFENSHRLLDKLGKRHCPGFVVAAKQVGLHP